MPFDQVLVARKIIAANPYRFYPAGSYFSGSLLTPSSIARPVRG